ncbi:hypothetical protein [Pseudomonas sp. ZS1P83]
MLTPLGYSLAPTLEAMKAWDKMYITQMPDRSQ